VAFLSKRSLTTVEVPRPPPWQGCVYSSSHLDDCFPPISFTPVRADRQVPLWHGPCPRVCCSYSIGNEVFQVRYFRFLTLFLPPFASRQWGADDQRLLFCSMAGLIMRQYFPMRVIAYQFRYFKNVPHRPSRLAFVFPLLGPVEFGFPGSSTPSVEVHARIPSWRQPRPPPCPPPLYQNVFLWESLRKGSPRLTFKLGNHPRFHEVAEDCRLGPFFPGFSTSSPSESNVAIPAFFSEFSTPPTWVRPKAQHSWCPPCAATHGKDRGFLVTDPEAPPSKGRQNAQLQRQIQQIVRTRSYQYP